MDSKVRLAIQPVKVNLDQDTAVHLFTFFTELSQLSLQDEPVYRDPSPTALTEDDSAHPPEKKEIFFKDVTFSPDLSIRVDYQVWTSIYSYHTMFFLLYTLILNCCYSFKI